jgi:hypothetical protein
MPLSVRDVSEPAFAAEPVAQDAARTGPEALDSAEAAELARRRQSAAPSSATYRQPARRTGGLTGRGVVTMILVATFLAGLLDMAISGHRGHLFGVVFAASSAAAALVVRRRDLTIAMIAPPLIYCVLIGVMALIDRGGLAGGFATTAAFYLGNAFVTGAPAIWTGTAVACLIGWYRLRH